MDPILITARVLHIGMAAAWFGHKLLIPPDIARSLQSPEEAHPLMVRLRRAEPLGIATGLGTLATGAILILLVGVSSVSAWVWVGLGLVVSATVLGATVGRPASARLQAAVRGNDLREARVQGKRLSRLLVSEALLWAAALVTMLL